MPSIGHEWVRAKAIKFGKPVGDVGEHRLDNNAAAGPANPNAVAIEPELARQSDRLAAAVPEKLRCSRHRRASSAVVYTTSIYHLRAGELPLPLGRDSHADRRDAFDAAGSRQ